MDHEHRPCGKDLQQNMAPNRRGTSSPQAQRQVGPTLLIDGDVLAYRIAAAVQRNEEDCHGYIQPFVNIMEGEAVLDNTILNLASDFEAVGIKIVLSDPESNWRLKVSPTYKSNRADTVRPLLLGRLKEHLRRTYGATHWAALEADDVLGILATDPEPGYEGDRIVVSKDKDMKCVPGKHHTIGHRDENGKPVVEIVTEASARWFHLMQTLAGDRVDGYEGCPGIGMTRAERILESPVRLVPTVGVVTRGKNKGSTTTKWVAYDTTDVWECIVSHYQKAGLGEEEALTTARLAYILHHDDYDRDTGKIRLWTPEEKLGSVR